MGESFGGWGVLREVNGIQGMVRLGISIVDNAPGAAVALSKDGTEVAVLRFNESKVQLQKSAEGNKMVNLATATPPQEYDLPLAEGMSAVNPCTYRKNQFSEVSVGGSASGTIEVGTAIATLPSGFRPQKTVERPAVYASANGAWTGGTVAITTDGIVRAYGQISATSVAFAVDFVAADY